MKVQNNVSFNLFSVDQSGQNNKASSSSFFSGDLNLTKPNDLIKNKLQEAREKAMKIVMDSFANELGTDKSLETRRHHITELSAKFKKNGQTIKEAEEIQRALKEQYGVAADSQEQKDLEDLMEKQKKIILNPEGGFPPRPPWLTEYQLRMLEADIPKVLAEDENEKILIDIEMENRIIAETNNERLKHRPILKATETAEDILNAASKEVQEMLYEDAKDFIEEKAKESEENGEVLAEKQKEMEEFIAKVRGREDEDENNGYTKEVTENMLTLDSESVSIQNEIKKIMSKMSVIEDELKGIKVDKKT